MESEGVYRRTGPLMRFAILLGVILTFLAGFQVFVLTDRTADAFAWTIASGTSATVLGAFYWTACAMAFLSWRRQPWARARVGVPGVLVFLWATLLTTVIHLDLFHLSVGSTSARVVAWIWLIVYIIDPVLFSVALFVQWRMPGEDPPRTVPLASAYRGVLVVSAALYGVLGIVMIILPGFAVSAAAWPLTPLTSRAVGSWVLGSAVVFATMWWENDADRIRPAAVGFLVVPILMLIGMVRYFGEFTSPGATGIFLVLVGILAMIGVIGTLAGRSVRYPSDEASS